MERSTDIHIDDDIPADSTSNSHAAEGMPLPPLDGQGALNDQSSLSIAPSEQEETDVDNHNEQAETTPAGLDVGMNDKTQHHGDMQIDSDNVEENKSDGRKRDLAYSSSSPGHSDYEIVNDSPSRIDVEGGQQELNGFDDYIMDLDDNMFPQPLFFDASETLVDDTLDRDGSQSHYDDATSTDQKVDHQVQEPARQAKKDMDLAGRIPHFYRILDLVKERGSGGLVDKIIISQETYGQLMNVVRPGAYTSITHCDFTALDKSFIKAVGVYGDKLEIVKYLEEIEAVDEEAAAALRQVTDEDCASQRRPHLRSGLYGVITRNNASDMTIHVIYWPEDNTWNDDAPSDTRRNRVTFIRYLTKITDQVVALISTAQAEALVWKSVEDDNDSDMDDDFSDRIVSFVVAKSMEQDEDVSIRDGFTLHLRKPTQPSAADQQLIDLDMLRPFLASGETSAGFVNVEFVSEEKQSRKLNDLVYPTGLKSLIKNKSFCLSQSLDEESLNILTAHGLGERVPRPYSELVQRRKTALDVQRSSLDQGTADIEARLENSKFALVAAVHAAFYDRLAKLHLDKSELSRAFFPETERDPCQDVPDGEAKDAQNTELHIEDHLAVLSGIVKMHHQPAQEVIDKSLKNIKLQTMSGEYQGLKESILYLNHMFDSSPEDAEKQVELIQAVFREEDIKKAWASVATPKESSKGLVSYITSFFSSDEMDRKMKEARNEVDSTSDENFLAKIEGIVRKYPTMAEHASTAVRLITQTAVKHALRKVKLLVERLTFIQRGDCIKQVSLQAEANKNNEFQSSRAAFLQAVKHEFILPDSPEMAKISSVSREDYAYCRDSFRLSGISETRTAPRLRYAVHLFDLRERDRHGLQSDPTLVPTPIIHDHSRFLFELPVTRRVLHLQILENHKCLLVTQLPNRTTEIFVDDLQYIGQALKRQGQAKKILACDKVGEHLSIAYDEIKRMLAVCTLSRSSLSEPILQLHVFVFDERYATLTGLGSATDLRPWYNPAVYIKRMVFTGQQDEIAFLDSCNRLRVFSLITQQFRPASVQLNDSPSTVFATPDGSCICCLWHVEDQIILRAFHWSNFGSAGGILKTIRDFPASRLCMTSFVNRSTIHMIGLDDSTYVSKSIALDITKKMTEFSFRERRGHSSQEESKGKTTNNCLLDCHSEVWTKFPVVAAVRRHVSRAGRQCKSLTFITDRNQHMFAPYFDNMISAFERATRKPTDKELQDIIVDATSFENYFSLSDRSLSGYCAGEWFMNLTCLIPIHIAVARDNRFIPFKDGVWSADLERSLLGAKVEQIVDNLSFGWYESIFQSYMPTKPVKVVSSMGEQSVGKSYALNHLCDTTFAGSAMRTTEGVWMSVTPTEEELIVALDFEGVHSIERSAQEDTLLVLFNTALSNLVLFRNNFALSRDIAGLFQSFQSSSTILDPDANPSLFKSTLVIIIKDVIESDKREITKEFRLKFQDIVKMEQGSNFITRLHGGSLDIIPWPVIESKEFYKLFPKLKQRLDKQPATHRQAGVFLMIMKTLMAKLKANDWGALSENMAAHRCLLLTALLPRALRFGAAEIEPDIEPLKDLDSNEAIEISDSGAVFWMSGLPNEHTPQASLSCLMQQWDLYGERANLDDNQWMGDLQRHLDTLFACRTDHVRGWLDVNTQRFAANSSSFELLRRQFESLLVDMKANVQICRLQCKSCSLLCLQIKHHEGDHDCQTSHECARSCHFADEHASGESCGLPAGHSGHHICDIAAHLCGEPCALDSKRGCLSRCGKVLGHEDVEHMCQARLHECGKPCSLSNVELHDGQLFSCLEACKIPSHEPHNIHECSTVSCPIRCQLCKRLCSNGNHLHGLNEVDSHLCGQEHPCNALCTSPGLCSIETTPYSVEATFTGKHESFQFTKYSQVHKRLQCKIPIPSGQLDHMGTHSHSLQQDAFHFCETRCENCGYFCTLPLGHPQQEHDTRHGSMSRTKWTIEGPEGTSIELNGRRFGASDDGAPMLCSMVCKDMGRHAHIDYCRSGDSRHCTGTELQHIATRLEPNPSKSKDWISHKLYWQRSGFKDPYSREEKTSFEKCDAMCAGPEHEATSTAPAQPSYCTLPLFHPPATGNSSGLGYVSNDGHHFDCRNPVVMKQAFHVIFVIDRSGSMGHNDRRPLPGTPNTGRISARHNNRLGAVYSSLDGFWNARNNVQATPPTAGSRSGAPSSAAAPPARRDAYSLILFDHNPIIVLQNDFASTPEALLNSVLAYTGGGGTDFNSALRVARQVMEAHWSTERTPVVIFLSDGECSVPDESVQDLCRRAVALGKPLSFHAVGFGTPNNQILRRMANLAHSVQTTAPPDPLHPSVPSSYTEALDTVRLAETFLGLADSLSKPRGFLMKG